MKYGFITDSCPPKSDLDRVSSSSVELTHFSISGFGCDVNGDKKARAFRISLDLDVASDRVRVLDKPATSWLAGPAVL